MIPLPGALGGTRLLGWRLDKAAYAAGWDSGLGAERSGGRWNSRGVAAVYASLDPSTAILEVAAHVRLRTLDVIPHVITGFEISEPAIVRIVPPNEIPEKSWLEPGIPSREQQRFGDELLASSPLIVLPSAVSSRSWNIILNPATSDGLYVLEEQSNFVLDPRLHSGA